MFIRIEERRDYELYVSKVIEEQVEKSDDLKYIFLTLAMQCFDDGKNYQNGNLKVKVDL